MHACRPGGNGTAGTAMAVPLLRGKDGVDRILTYASKRSLSGV